MNYRVVEEKVMTELLEEPFNPPLFDVEFSEIDFILEYEEIHERLVGECDLLGFTEDECNIWARTPSPPSRRIQVIVQCERAWDTSLIQAFHHVVTGCEPEYSLWIFHEVMSLKPCHLLLTRDRCIGSGEINELTRVGF